MDEPEPIFAPDPITLVCLFAAFTCGMGAWLDLLTPDLLRHFGRTTSALVVRTDLRMLASGGHDDAITYRFRDSRGAMHERREHVSSLADFELPREGSRLRVRYLERAPFLCKLAGNETPGYAGWLLEAAFVVGLAGLGNFRQWRFSERPG